MFKVDQLKVVAAAFILLIAYRSLCCFHYLIPCMINWLISSSKKKKKKDWKWRKSVTQGK